MATLDQLKEDRKTRKTTSIPASVLSGGPVSPAVLAKLRAHAEEKGWIPKSDPKGVVKSAGFRDFMRATSPADWNIDYPHLAYLRERLAQVTIGACKRLMVFMPPRHTKSESITVRYPVYRLERNRTMRVAIAAYNHDLATKFSRLSRNIAQERIALAPDRLAADDWQTVEGGGIRAVGVGGGLTGHGADLIVIDDPVKSREEAESELYRNKVWDWYTTDLYTRLEPDAAIILVMTRWNEDDLAGRILTSDQASQWSIVSLPALAEECDPIGRSVGEPLCADRYDLAALEDIRETQGSYAFDALYQQRPTPREGAFFKVGAFKVVEEVPPGLKACRAWDQAATEGGGDWTVGVRLAGPDRDGIWYVTDVVRGQWSTDERNRRIRATAVVDGPQTRIRGATDPGSAGVDAGKAFVQMLAGHTVKTVRVSGGKESRADPVSSQVNAGNVRLLRGGWNAAFLSELRVFPNGKYDDQVDALSDAFTEMATKRRGRAY